VARREVLPRLDWGTIAVASIGIVLVIVGTFMAVAGGAAATVVLLVAFFGLASLMAAALQKPAVIVGLLVIASAIQRAVAASTQDVNSLLLDDIVLVGLVIFTAQRILTSSEPRTKVLLISVVGLLVVATARATNLTIGVGQFRQMLVPIALLAFGAVLTRQELRRAGPIVILAIALGAIYGIAEQTGWRPIDPLGAHSLRELSYSVSRDGLPNSYYYYPSNGVRIERSGGLILNPPSFGMLAATGLLWLWFTRNSRSILTVVTSVIFVAAAIFSYGRGGFVILGLAAVQPFLSRKSGKLAFLGVGVALGYVAFTEFSTDGESARHVNGFFGGLMYAIANPLGGGFGTAGNALSKLGIDNESGAGESLAAIFLASIGWPGILLIGWLLWRGIARGTELSGVALTSAIIVSLVSETAGGLDATGPLWILAGFALSKAANDPGEDLREQSLGSTSIGSSKLAYSRS
jgi:hypothetical protein